MELLAGVVDEVELPVLTRQLGDGHEVSDVLVGRAQAGGVLRGGQEGPQGGEGLLLDLVDEELALLRERDHLALEEQQLPAVEWHGGHDLAVERGLLVAEVLQ